MTSPQPNHAQLTQGQIDLLKAQVWKERAIMAQSLMMALLTGVSAAAVGIAMYQGRHPPTMGMPQPK